MKKKNHKIKPYSITASARRIIIVAVIPVVITCLIVGTIFFEGSAMDIYEEMMTSLTGVMKQCIDEEIAEELAESVHEVYRSIDDPKELYQTDRDAYFARFQEVQDSELYGAMWDALDDVRRKTTASSLDMVLLYPEDDMIIYIMDVSGANVLHCGFQHPHNLKAYRTDPGRDFDAIFSTSPVYGTLRTDGVSLYVDKEKGIYAYLTADIPLSEVMIRTLFYFAHTALIAVLITVLICLIVSRRVNRDVAEPLHRIAESTEQFVGNYELRVENHDETHIFENLDGGRILELRQVADSIQSMELEMNSYLRDLDTMAAERARISAELEIGARIQASALPSVFPPFPERKEFDLFASMDPAKEVGGDFYDFFLIDEDHLGLVMADVSGKGIPGALFMMESKSLLRNHTAPGCSPAEVLHYVNERLCEQNAADMFVTIWFGILTISTGEVVAANAGHEYPAIAGVDGKYELMLDKHSFVCGGMEGIRYQESRFTLEKGGRLFIYTDGVPEATNRDEELFGTERLISALNQGAASPEETIQGVTEAIDGFVGEAEQFDDTTMLSLFYRG